MSEENDKNEFFHSIYQDDSSKVKSFVLNENLNIWQSTNKQKFTGLGYAVAYNKEEACKILLNEIKKRKDFSNEKYKTWIEGQDEQSRPLIMSAIKGYTNIMKLLLANGADISKKEGSLGVLQVAAIHNNSQYIQNYINVIKTSNHLSEKFIIDETDSEGNSAIHLVVKKDNINFQDVIKVLLNFGADINLKNSRFQTPLHIAIANDNINLIRFLISCDADLYVQNEDGETLKETLNKNCQFDDDVNNNLKKSIFSAVKTNDVIKLKKLLSDKYLDIINIIDELDAYEYTILHSAVFNDYFDQVQIQIEYVKRNNDPLLLNSFVNRRSKEGYTPLLLAAYRGNIKIIKLLIENGGDYRLTNKMGLSVLHMAAQGNQPSVIIYFKEKYDLDLNLKDNVGSTVLHWTCYSGSQDVLILLMYYKVEINIKDREGNTPLLLSIIFEKINIIKRLIHYGADKEIKNNEGENMMSIIKKKNLPNLNELNVEDKYPLANIYVKKVPLEKLEKTTHNIYLFTIIHIVIALMVTFLIVKPIFIHSYLGISLSFIYYTLIIMIIGLFRYLVYSNPGKMENTKKLNLLGLVENNENMKNYCPFCVVEKNIYSKHCIICNICVDRYDHHCYWIDNCVGKCNYKAFMAFILLINVNVIFTLILGLGGVYFECKYDQEYRIYKLIFDILLIAISFIFLLPVVNILRLNLKCFYSDLSRIQPKTEKNELKIALLEKEKPEEEKNLVVRMDK